MIGIFHDISAYESEVGLSHYDNDIECGFLRTGCRGEYLDLREGK
jgi:hypothetical protein